MSSQLGFGKCLYATATDTFVTALAKERFGEKRVNEYKNTVGGEIYLGVAGEDGVHLRGEFLLKAV